MDLNAGFSHLAPEQQDPIARKAEHQNPWPDQSHYPKSK